MRSRDAARRSSDCSAANGLLPIRKGQNGQPTIPHRRTSIAWPQQQSRHFARMTDVHGRRSTPSASSSATVSVRGSHPIRHPSPAMAGSMISGLNRPKPSVLILKPLKRPFGPSSALATPQLADIQPEARDHLPRSRRATRRLRAKAETEAAR